MGDNQDAATSSYIEDGIQLNRFMKEFTCEIDGHVKVKYTEMLQDIANRKRTTLEIDLNDMMGFFDDDDVLVQRIQTNAVRYCQILASQVDDIMPEPTDVDAIMAAEENIRDERNAETLREQRLAQQNANDEDEDAPIDPHHQIPPELLRRYEVVLMPPAKVKAQALRDVKATRIGNLVRVRGIVTRVSDVKPMVVVATYACDNCGFEIYQKVGAKEFSPLDRCPSGPCKQQPGGARLHLQTRGSKFIKFQELKLQEMPDQVPIGHIPRSMNVHVSGSCTRQCSPGDSVDIAGVFLPEPVAGFKRIKMGLITNTYLECMHITRQKKSYKELGNELSEELEDEIDELASDPDLYDKLSRSIAPEIFGLEDVKKALLLQLVGGVTRKMQDGMSIRGDINICLMGDPGVAKSQLLKHISSVAPRGVYTTGKGSSGVGLTAAVTRDPVTKEIALEGGALVLADMGICCIDEFDKMEDSDRTAIHEVMEQQTVSIAKAGVTTTLNARTSILAAANPLFGRYNRRYSPADNINLPAALLSRFDLLFLLLDVPNIQTDTALAKHVTHVHQHSCHPPLDFNPLSSTFIRAYISQARKVEPCIPPALSNMIVEEYVNMRQKDKRDAIENGSQSMLTARQLLSILRMSQALARLRFDEEVSQSDIAEAIRLTRVSKSSLELEDSNPAFGGGEGDLVTRIYNLLYTHSQGGQERLKYSDIEPIVISRGFTVDQLERTLNEYEELNVIHLNTTRTTITFVNSN